MHHPTAVIEQGVELGAGVDVGPGAVIRSGARIGDGCRIGPHAVVTGFVSMGPRCRVHAGAVLGDDPQDLAFGGGESRVVIGAGCVLREGVTVHRGTKPGSETVLGDECFLMVNSHCAHNVRLGDRVIVANGALLAGYVEVGERAFVSGCVAVHQFVRVGRLAMLGGGAMVSKDVPPFCTLTPAALNRVGGINLVGVRRAGLSPEDVAAIRAAFKLFFRSGLGAREAAAEIRRRFASGPALELAGFAETSKRGLCRMRQAAADGLPEDGEGG